MVEQTNKHTKLKRELILPDVQLVEDLLDAGNKELTGAAAFVQLLEFDRDARAVGFLRSESHRAQKWRREGLYRTGRKVSFHNSIHLFGDRSVNAISALWVRPSRGLFKKKRSLERAQEAGAKAHGGVRTRSGNYTRAQYSRVLPPR